MGWAKLALDIWELACYSIDQRLPSSPIPTSFGIPPFAVVPRQARTTSGSRWTETHGPGGVLWPCRLPVTWVRRRRRDSARMPSVACQTAACAGGSPPPPPQRRQRPTAEATPLSPSPRPRTHARSLVLYANARSASQAIGRDGRAACGAPVGASPLLASGLATVPAATDRQHARR